MSTGATASRYALIVGLFSVGAVVGWWVLAGRESADHATATATLRAAPAAVAQTTSSAATKSVSSVAENAPGHAPAVQHDQPQQDAKIARGLARNPGGGVLVEGVPEGSIVSELRVEPGDVIVSVNGSPITSPDEFARIYREQGLPRQMTVIHDGREIHRH